MNAPEPLRRFRYVARDAEGRRQTGNLRALDETQARAELRRLGLFPISLAVEGAGPAAQDAPAPQGAAKEPPAAGTTSARAARAAPASASTKPAAQALGDSKPARALRLPEQAQLLEALARLTERRISPDRALLIMSRGSTRGLVETAERVRRQVRTGRSLPEALVEAGALTDPAAEALLRAGDASGDLPGALDTAARILNSRLAAIRRLVSSLMYPAILLAVSLASIGIVLVVIIPEFRPLVAERFDLVPPLGRAIFAVSGALESLWPLFLAGISLIGLAIASLLRRGQLTAALLRIARRLPVVGPAVSDNRAMLTLRILGALLARRVPMVRALEILAATPPDPDRVEQLRSAMRRVERGEPLSDAAEAEGLVPAAAIEIMRIGEETGTLPVLLARAADDLEESATRRLASLLTLIEPALIVGVGLVIGISLYALFTAITAVNTIVF